MFGVPSGSLRLPFHAMPFSTWQIKTSPSSWIRWRPKLTLGISSIRLLKKDQEFLFGFEIMLLFSNHEEFIGPCWEGAPHLDF